MLLFILHPARLGRVLAWWVPQYRSGRRPQAGSTPRSFLLPPPPHQAEPLQVFQLSSPSSLGTVSPNWVIESEGFLMPEPERLRASLRCPSSLEQAQCSPVLSAAGIFSQRFCWNRVDLLCVCHVTIVAGFVFCVSVSRGEWSEASTHRRAPTGPQHAAPRSGPWLRPLCSILCGHALFTLMYASTWSSVSSLMKFLF